METLDPIPTLPTWKWECQQCTHVHVPMHSPLSESQHSTSSRVKCSRTVHTQLTYFYVATCTCVHCVVFLHVGLTKLLSLIHTTGQCDDSVMPFSHEPHSCVSCYSWTWTRLTLLQTSLVSIVLSYWRWCHERIVSVADGGSL